MRILLVDTWIHHKNKDSILRMAKTAQWNVTISKDASTFNAPYDLVFVPTEFIPARVFPNAKRIVYGPHNFVIVSEPWITQRQHFDRRCVYNYLSKWVCDVEQTIAPTCMPVVALPFSVDTQRFAPRHTAKTQNCFVYVKHRDETIVRDILARLQNLNLTFSIIGYGSYNEEEYIRTVQTSEFGVWIGSHESQGFALEEALSMNCPLLVHDATSMFDEIVNGRCAYAHLKGKYLLLATSIPYWDERCGIRIESTSELEDGVRKIREGTFSPREFILETLTDTVCLNRFLQAVPYTTDAVQ